MDDLLTPVSTTYLKHQKDPELVLTEAKSTKRVDKVEADRNHSISSADEASDALKSQPDYDSLISVLRFLTNDKPSSNGFSIQSPGAKSATIVQLLVSEIAPNYWTLLLEGSVDDSTPTQGSRSHDAELFLQCLQSITGLNATIAQIRALIQESKLDRNALKRPDLSLNLATLLSLLAAILDGDTSVRTIWKSSAGGLSDPAVKKVQAQQLISILTNGRLVSISAEASAVIGRQEVPPEAKWIVDGVEYSKWMGQNITIWAKLFPTEDELKFCADLFQRSMSLGYSGMDSEMLE